MSFFRRALPCLVLWIGARMGFPTTAAAAAAPAAWQPFSHVSFRHHTEDALQFGTSRAQDPGGFLRLGTQTGLVRWDGVRARRYLAGPTQEGGRPDGFILSDAGGALRVAATERLRAAVGQTDCVARPGGGEFAVLLTPANDAIVGDVARRIVDSMRTPVTFGPTSCTSAPASAPPWRGGTVSRRKCCTRKQIRRCTAPRKRAATPGACSRPTSSRQKAARV